MNRKFLLLCMLIVLNLVFIIGVTLLAYNRNPSRKSLHDPISWDLIIKQQGPKEAYHVLLTTYQDERAIIQHTKAHEFGKAMYEVEGLKGIINCDSSFGFGCYHSFFIAAITDKGEKIIPQLYQTCVKQYGILGTGCQHGIGHGILEYASPGNVLTAINLCNNIQTYRYLGCSSGVFMDYFFPLEQKDKTFSVSSHHLDNEDPEYPCAQVSPPYTSSCYYELGSYSLSYSSEGTVCSDIKDKQKQEACFLGFGASVARKYNYNTDNTSTVCSKVSNQLACYSGAAWEFFANPQSMQKEAILCSYSPDESTCLEKADLTKILL